MESVLHNIIPFVEERHKRSKHELASCSIKSRYMKPREWIAQMIVVLIEAYAQFGDLGDSWHDFCQTVIAAMFVWIGYLMFEQKEVAWTIVCGAIVVLFHPLAQINLGPLLTYIAGFTATAIAVHSVIRLSQR